MSFACLLFTATTALTLFLLGNAVVKVAPKKAVSIVVPLCVWLVLQAALSLNAVYNTNLHLLPPKIALFGILPAMMLLVALFSFKNTRHAVQRIPLKSLVLISLVRIPVEIGLNELYQDGGIPKIMTFEGANFDIVSGISALLVYGILKRSSNNLVKRYAVLVWNTGALILLLIIVVLATISLPTPLQKFGFEQPNTAILNFPFSWLPTFIVPVVLFSHVAIFRKISQLSKQNTALFLP